MIIVGDTHGNFGYLEYLFKNMTGLNLFHVGDFGMGDNIVNGGITLKRLDAKLNATNNTMWVIRGNHDNPAFWTGDHMYDNIKLIPDYTVVEAEGKRFLGVGGAISVDRVPRLDGIGFFWPDELFVLDREKLAEMRDIDVVVTHTAPHFTHPVGINGFVRSYAEDDPMLIQELAKERLDLTEMYDILKENNTITDWLYGHFHTNKLTLHEGVKFRVIGVNDTYDLRFDVEIG
jgi:DNA repair exonuclease SbcCD nuclease subunit